MKTIGNIKMNQSKYFYYLILLIVLTNIVLAEPQAKDTSNIYFQVEKMGENVREIRRDQLNYQIERDLLKDAFSSHYQTVNIVLTIVLGVFSLVGFFGLRDIGSIKKGYLEELEKLNLLRKDFEIKVGLYESEQKKAIENYSSIVKINDDQNRRIKILELQEKISSLMNSNNYQRALEYIAIAIEMDPNNLWFYNNKGLSLWRVGDLSGAISSFSQAHKLDSDDISTIENLAELFLLTKRFDEYSTLYSKYKQTIATKDSSVTCFYFEALELYLKQDSPKLKLLVINFLSTVPSEKQRRTHWDFNDALKALAPKPDEQLGSMFLLIIAFLRGEIGQEEILKKFDSLE